MNTGSRIVAGLAAVFIVGWVLIRIAVAFSALAVEMSATFGLSGKAAIVWYAAFALVVPVEILLLWWGQKKIREQAAHPALMKFREGWLSDEAAEAAEAEHRAGRNHR